MILTPHARQTMKSRGITMQTALELVHNPQVIEPCLVSKKHPEEGRERRVRGPLAAVVRVREDGHPVVVTFLLRQREKWVDADVVAVMRTTKTERPAPSWSGASLLPKPLPTLVAEPPRKPRRRKPPVEHRRVLDAGRYGPHDDSDPTCHGSACPGCGCCMHCDGCSECTCRDTECGCYVPRRVRRSA